MKINSDKIAIVFKSVSYDIDDIRIVWYDEDNKKLKWYCFSDKDPTDPYYVLMSQEKAQQYIDYINNHKYDKIIKF